MPTHYLTAVCFLLMGAAGWVIVPPATGQGGTLEPHLALVREWTIGAADGPPEYAFGRLDGMATHSNGSFFLFDAADVQIRQYDASGRFRALVGRSGAGPGEYRSVVGMGVHGDSLLVVYDPGNGRISLFDMAGRYRRSLPFARGGFFAEKAFAMDRGGLLYLRAARLSGSSDRTLIPTQFVRMRLDGSLVDSIPLPPDPQVGQPFVLMTSDGPRWSFPVREIYAVLPSGGLATANSATYRVTVAQPRGPPRVLVRPESHVSLTGAERAEWEAFARYTATQHGHAPSPIPPVKPSVRDLIADAFGRIWVNVYTTGRKRDVPQRPAKDPHPLLTIREPNVYDIFDSTGAYLGRTELPPASALMGIGAERIWVRTELESGQQVLSCYRIAGLTTH